MRISNYRFNFRAISLIELENICRNMKKKKDYNWNTVGNILLRIISVGDWNIPRGLEGIDGDAYGED